MRNAFRYILISILFFSTFGFVEQSAIASKMPTEVIVSTGAQEGIVLDPIVETTAHEASAEHEGPHIPAPKGKIIEGWSIG